MDIKDIKKEWNATIVGCLKALQDICREHNLRYYCCAGTAIGAVRHHGIIPWDDDIDVIMPRPDYDRLLELAKTEDFGKYRILTPYDDDAYPLFFSKIINAETTLVEERQFPSVIGLFVDIFPLDATTDDEREARRLKDRYTKLLNRLNAASSHNTFSEYLSLLMKPKEWGRFCVKTLAFFCRHWLRRRLMRQMERISHAYDYAEAKNVIVYSGSYGYREIFPKEWLGDGREFPFEDVTALLPERYDEYLRHFFGDYMQLPPVEQRIEKHNRAYLNIHRRESLDEIRRKAGFRI